MLPCGSLPLGVQYSLPIFNQYHCPHISPHPHSPAIPVYITSHRRLCKRCCLPHPVWISVLGPHGIPFTQNLRFTYWAASSSQGLSWLWALFMRNVFISMNNELPKKCFLKIIAAGSYSAASILQIISQVQKYNFWLIALPFKQLMFKEFFYSDETKEKTVNKQTVKRVLVTE